MDDRKMPPATMQRVWWIGRPGTFGTPRLTVAQPLHSGDTIVLQRGDGEIRVRMEEVPQIIEALATISEGEEE